MKKTRESKREIHPAMINDLHQRLDELEKELRNYPSRPPDERLLKLIEKPQEKLIGEEKTVQFVCHEKLYAAGHTDVTYAGSNHARGVRHIRFYVGESLVLDIEGDYEDQQFGSNFRFHSVQAYVPGEWEADFIHVTDDLRQRKAKRKSLFTKKRATEHRRMHRSHSA
jgi:hypothetical protein